MIMPRTEHVRRCLHLGYSRAQSHKQNKPYKPIQIQAETIRPEHDAQVVAAAQKTSRGEMAVVASNGDQFDCEY